MHTRSVIEIDMLQIKKSAPQVNFWPEIFCHVGIRLFEIPSIWLLLCSIADLPCATPHGKSVTNMSCVPPSTLIVCSYIIYCVSLLRYGAAIVFILLISCTLRKSLLFSFGSTFESRGDKNGIIAHIVELATYHRAIIP